MSLSLTQSAVSLIESLGYTGYAVGLIVDSAGIPIPSEVLVPLATVSAAQGTFNIVTVVVIGVLAQTVGGVLAYVIGQRGGLPLIHQYGKYFLISQHDLEVTHRAFAKYGQWLAFIGRCIPVVRGYIGFVAGIAEMSFGRFLLATVLGSLLWTLFLTYLGYKLSKDITVIDTAIKPFTYLVLGAVGAAAVLLVGRRLREAKA